MCGIYLPTLISNTPIDNIVMIYTMPVLTSGIIQPYHYDIFGYVTCIMAADLDSSKKWSGHNANSYNANNHKATVMWRGLRVTSMSIMPSYILVLQLSWMVWAVLTGSELHHELPSYLVIMAWFYLQSMFLSAWDEIIVLGQISCVQGGRFRISGSACGFVSGVHCTVCLQL